MRRFFPLAVILALFLGSNAGAAIPLYTGSFNVASGGQIQDPNAPTGTHCVAVATNVYQYGSGCVSSIALGSGLTNSGTAENPIIALSGTSGVSSITCNTNITCTNGATPTIQLIASPSVTNLTASATVQAATALFTPAGASSNTVPAQYNDGGATPGMAESIPSGSTNGYRFFSNASGTLTQVLQIVVPSGNATFLGNVTAANFFNGSRAEWKTNIRDIDGLRIVDHTHVAQYDCAKPQCGPKGEHKIGIIANDSSVEIAGKKHDHYDAFALAAAEADAIKTLQLRIDILSAKVARLEQERKH